ncbi:hypothetical protein F8M41_015693 [Gigaspora margarita]|uniref:Uncharacterized protein n=1 Tax=Gigaspora margarita TaxID=4874 RepID=A0A8H3WW03_GIGMA|nr:hypothetical protein F8M41_015693 [Gigaspora margarita]
MTESGIKQFWIVELVLEFLELRDPYTVSISFVAMTNNITLCLSHSELNKSIVAPNISTIITDHQFSPSIQFMYSNNEQQVDYETNENGKIISCNLFIEILDIYFTIESIVAPNVSTIIADYQFSPSI